MLRGDNEEADQRASIERRTWLIKAVHRAKEAGVAMDGQRQCIYLCWWWFTCRVLCVSQQTQRVEVWRSIRVPPQHNHKHRSTIVDETPGNRRLRPAENIVPAVTARPRAVNDAHCGDRPHAKAAGG